MPNTNEQGNRGGSTGATGGVGEGHEPPAALRAAPPASRAPVRSAPRLGKAGTPRTAAGADGRCTEGDRRRGELGTAVAQIPGVDPARASWSSGGRRLSPRRCLAQSCHAPRTRAEEVAARSSGSSSSRQQQPLGQLAAAAAARPTRSSSRWSSSSSSSPPPRRGAAPPRRSGAWTASWLGAGLDP